jgi:K+-transporting ATPase ATPase C chain
MRSAVGIYAALLLIAAVAYTFFITGIAQVAFERQADGSLVERDGQLVGSSLIGQSFAGPEYFHGRPSAGEGAASNLGPTNPELIDRIETGAAEFRSTNGVGSELDLPADAVTTSASGLDPHITPASARLQAARVAQVRGVSEAEVMAILDEHTEGSVLYVLGAPRVNVLEVNLALDRRFPEQ